MNTTALILEGGGMRGLYGAGVLDFFASKNLEFNEIVSVSMGACNGASFISGQSKRNISIPMNFVNDRRYLSYIRWFCGGELFDMNFIFKTIPYELDIFNYEEFKQSKMRLNIVATDCISGDAKYYNNFTCKDDFLQILKSSCSLPFIAKPILYKNNILMDGGISDPIPLKYTQRLGVDKIVLILTQPKNFIKSAFKLNRILSLVYPKYKGLQRAMRERHINYNKVMKEIDTLENNGEIFVIRPQKQLLAKRIDRDKKRVMATYMEGVKDASATFESLEKYLKC